MAYEAKQWYLRSPVDGTWLRGEVQGEAEVATILGRRRHIKPVVDDPLHVPLGSLIECEPLIRVSAMLLFHGVHLTVEGFQTCSSGGRGVQNTVELHQGTVRHGGTHVRVEPVLYDDEFIAVLAHFDHRITARKPTRRGSSGHFATFLCCIKPDTTQAR